MEHYFETVHYQDKEIILIPTAHVSADSAAFVQKTIEEQQPDCIAIELDEDRYKSIKNPKKWEDTNIVDVIKKKQTGYMFANLILSNYQKKIAKNLNSSSGAEMVMAMNESEERNIPLVLADRPIKTTFIRIWRKQNFIDKCKLLLMIVSSLFDEEELSEEDLLKLQQKDVLAAAMNEMSEKLPQISEVLLHERDLYLSSKLQSANGKKIVAVLGAAHVPGIKEAINTKIDISEIETIPPKSLFSKMIGWLIPAILVFLVIITFSKNTNLAFQQITQWIIWNGSLSALGCLVALANPLTILVAFIAAPLTSLSPLLAAGWFAGICEAFIAKPQVKDFDRLNEDLNSLKGFWHNKITRILLIVILANVGSTIGTFIGGLDIVQKFFSAL